MSNLILLMSGFCLCAFSTPAYGVKYIDLSYPIGNKTVLWPTHRRLQRLVDAEHRDESGQWMASYSITMSEHTSSHIDSPYHVYPTGWKLSEIPNNRLYNVTGVMIDLSKKINNPNAVGGVQPNYAVLKEDIMEWELRNGKIPPNSLVLIRTGWGDKFSNPKEFLGTNEKNDVLAFPGVGLSAARFLSNERLVYGVGIDTVSLDTGYSKTFPAHVFFGSRNIYMIENVANLQLVPAKGFQAFVFPIKLDQATGSPVRIFAVM